VAAASTPSRRRGFAALVELHAEESQIALPRFLSEGRSFDLAFIDRNHRFDGVFLDLVLTNLGWTLAETGADGDLHHWAVLLTSRQPDARSFDHYVEL
jgi:hypothetical protein